MRNVPASEKRSRLQVVYIAPPPGLLDIGRRRMLLSYLRPILQVPSSVTAWWPLKGLLLNSPRCKTAALLAALCCCTCLHTRLSHWVQGVAASNAKRDGHLVAYMPSHQSLVQGGHAHLVPLIEAAGGFLEVCPLAKDAACQTA